MPVKKLYFRQNSVGMFFGSLLVCSASNACSAKKWIFMHVLLTVQVERNQTICTLLNVSEQVIKTPVCLSISMSRFSIDLLT